LPVGPPNTPDVDILVAAFHREVRAALHGRLSDGGMGAELELDSAAALERALADFAEPLVVTGLRWPETAPFLAAAASHEVPVALLLEEKSLDARHAAFRAGAAALLPWPIPATSLAHALASIDCGFRLLPRGRSLHPATRRCHPRVFRRVSASCSSSSPPGSPTRALRAVSISPSTPSSITWHRSSPSSRRAHAPKQSRRRPDAAS